MADEAKTNESSNHSKKGARMTPDDITNNHGISIKCISVLSMQKVGLNLPVGDYVSYVSTCKTLGRSKLSKHFTDQLKLNWRLLNKPLLQRMLSIESRHKLIHLYPEEGQLFERAIAKLHKNAFAKMDNPPALKDYRDKIRDNLKSLIAYLKNEKDIKAKVNQLPVSCFINESPLILEINKLRKLHFFDISLKELLDDIPAPKIIRLATLLECLSFLFFVSLLLYAFSIKFINYYVTFRH